MKHKRHFNMKVIAAKTDCGAAMCMIGHVLDLSGYRMRLCEDGDGFLDFDFIAPSGRRLKMDVHVKAERLLGMTRDESSDLFMDYSLKTPKQAAARISQLIAEAEAR